MMCLRACDRSLVQKLRRRKQPLLQRRKKRGDSRGRRKGKLRNKSFFWSRSLQHSTRHLVRGEQTFTGLAIHIYTWNRDTVMLVRPISSLRVHRSWNGATLLGVLISSNSWTRSEVEIYTQPDGSPLKVVQSIRSRHSLSLQRCRWS
jgi:hypothetical protein